MSLSKSEAEKHGLKFYREDETSPADPDQPIYEADLTLDNHTVTFAGKSEEEVLAQAERFLLGRGRISRDEEEAVESEKLDSQPGPDEPVHEPFVESEQYAAEQEAETEDSDVHDERNDNDDSVADEDED